MRKTKRAMPKSTATNAHELLSEIAALAVEEPKRIAMGAWLARSKAKLAGYFRFDEKEHEMPACNTVGCIGGWTEALKPRQGSASRILGLDACQTNVLFYDRRLCEAPNQQTRGHARAVVRHIRAFQKQYRDQLLATRV